MKLNALGGPKADAAIVRPIGDEDDDVHACALRCVQERWIPVAEQPLLRELEIRRSTVGWYRVQAALRRYRSDTAFRAMVRAYEEGCLDALSRNDLASHLLFYPCKQSEAILHSIRNGADERLRSIVRTGGADAREYAEASLHFIAAVSDHSAPR